ncbi:Uncharacterised protein [Vibrio cholerae]|nr:Uncharacterised protein [Vibrio cholerae]CSI36180.1 Uncharacterised protein [Vibrio cholerae]CSI55591.1 Uncharacterised protein [Vibrio cholerae]
MLETFRLIDSSTSHASGPRVSDIGLALASKRSKKPTPNALSSGAMYVIIRLDQDVQLMTTQSSHPCT